MPPDASKAGETGAGWFSGIAKLLVQLREELPAWATSTTAPSCLIYPTAAELLELRGRGAELGLVPFQVWHLDHALGASSGGNVLWSNGEWTQISKIGERATLKMLFRVIHDAKGDRDAAIAAVFEELARAGTHEINPPNGAEFGIAFPGHVFHRGVQGNGQERRVTVVTAGRSFAGALARDGSAAARRYNGVEDAENDSVVTVEDAVDAVIAMGGVSGKYRTGMYTKNL